MTDDVPNLAPDERRRLLRALRALPSSTPITEVDLVAVVERIRSKREAQPQALTLGELIDALIGKDREENGNAKETLLAKLDAIGAKMRTDPNYRRTPATRAEQRTFERWFSDYVARLNKRSAWFAACRKRYGDHRTNPVARPWPDMPADLRRF